MSQSYRLISVLSICVCTLLAPASALAAPSMDKPKPEPDLFLAIGQQDAAAVKALLAAGASANSRNTLEMTPLMMAAASGSREIVDTLLAAGADISARSPFGTALTFAAFDSKPEIIRRLLEKGAAVTGSRPDRISVLMLAARSGGVDSIRQLLAKKPQVNAVDNHGSTALSYAARAGHAQAARLLLTAGSRLDAADADGWTPLMHAAVNGHAEVVSLLLKKGAGVRLKDRKGRTALLLAASYGDNASTARVLLSAGADIHAKDTKGRSALWLAERRGYAETARTLRVRGARAELASRQPLPAPRQAAAAGLRRIEHAMQVFAKRTGCVSCHHEGIARFATGFARSRGFAINGAFAREQEKRVLASIDEIGPPLRKAVQNPAEIKHVPIVDVGDFAPGYGTLLLGLSEHATPPSDALADTAMVLARIQSPEGDWRFGFSREPVQSSFFTMTAMSIRAVQRYAPKHFSGEVGERIARAKQWLLSAPARNTEDRAFRLLGLKWAGATTAERSKSLEELLSAQRADGGWAQLPSMRSDAYATGSALFALNQGGDLPASDAAYQRGVRFLLRTQEDDGTWYVYKRAVPANNYFDAEFPYGQSQYSSHAAACWATLALILAGDSSTVAAGR